MYDHPTLIITLVLFYIICINIPFSVFSLFLFVSRSSSYIIIFLFSFSSSTFLSPFSLIDFFCVNERWFNNHMNLSFARRLWTNHESFIHAEFAVTVRGHLLVQHFPSDFPCTKQTNGWTRLALIIHRKPLVHPFLWDLNWMHGTCPNQAHEPFFAYVCFCVNIVVPIRRLSCMFLVPIPLATETMTPWPICIHFQEYLAEYLVCRASDRQF